MKITIFRESHEHWRVLSIKTELPTNTDEVTEKCPASISERINEEANPIRKWGTACHDTIWSRGLAKSLLSQYPENLFLLKESESITLDVLYAHNENEERTWKIFVDGPWYHNDWWNHVDCLQRQNCKEISWRDFKIPASKYPHVHLILSQNTDMLYDPDCMEPIKSFLPWAKLFIKEVTEWMIESADKEAFFKFRDTCEKEYPKGIQYRNTVWQTKIESIPEIFKNNDPCRIAKIMLATPETRQAWMDWFDNGGKPPKGARKSKILKVLSVITHRNSSINGKKIEINRHGWWTKELLLMTFRDKSTNIHQFTSMTARNQQSTPNLETWMYKPELLHEIESHVRRECLRTIRNTLDIPGEAAAIIARWMKLNNLSVDKMSKIIGKSPEKAKYAAQQFGKEYLRNPSFNWQGLIEEIHAEILQHDEKNAGVFSLTCCQSLPIHVIANLAINHI